MLVLMGATYFALSAGLSYQRRTDALIDLEQSGMNALSHITRELAEANYETVEVQAGPPSAITFSSYRGLEGSIRYNGDGRQVWDTIVCIQILTQGTVKRLVRQAEEVGGGHLDPVLPSELTPSRNPAYFVGSSVATRVLANNIERLTVQSATTGSPKTLSLTLDFAIRAQNHTYGLKLTGKVHPRN